MRSTRKHARSGGFFVSVTSERFITDALEFTGSESRAQWWLFLGRLKETNSNLPTIVHDDACHLRRFAQSRSGWSSLANPLTYPSMKYILDKFHAKGHVDPWCTANVAPDTPENAQILLGKNTSICETTFQWLSRYKHMYRKMNRWSGNFFRVRARADAFQVSKTSCPAGTSSSSSSSESASSVLTGE